MLFNFEYEINQYYRFFIMSSKSLVKTEIKSSKAVKVVKSIPETTQLEVFISSLGCSTAKSEIYMYDGKVYINSDLILPVLNVQIKWFLQNSENTVHYITIKKRIFVNKYGLIKLLSQSKEQVAFLLQDYIFEVITKLETTGSVTIKEVESRGELIKTMAELDMYKSLDSRNTIIFQETENALKTLQKDYAYTERELTELKEKYNKLVYEHDNTTKNYDSLKLIAKKLASYVKIQSTGTKLKNKLVEELYNIDEESGSENDLDQDDENYANEVQEIKKQAVQAKQDLIKRNKTKPKKESTEQKEYKTQTQWYVMKSTDSLFSEETGEELFRWSITNSLPTEEIVHNGVTYEDFKMFSQDYSLGDLEQTKYTYIWYCDVNLSSIGEKIISKVFNIIGYISETSVLNLLKTVI